ncbi:MAG: right-handed parallel beta-helix repeat-containing protein [Verrucomicrobia bacterium]|jgi:hypothetical protein|nr:right-handed parallel beta-helix repeat-containing protein [Verrucomicrobiota bacterium]
MIQPDLFPAKFPCSRQAEHGQGDCRVSTHPHRGNDPGCAWRGLVGWRQLGTAGIGLLLLAVVPATAEVFIVSQTGDSGPGSLRQAIVDANAHPGPDQIHFQLPGPPPHYIRPLSPLPNITEALLMDGRTQSGYGGQPIVILAGNLAPSDTTGLRITASGVTVQSLIIQGFPAYGIELYGGSSNTITACWIGTDATGQTAVANGFGGVRIYRSAHNLVGGDQVGAGNVISGNGFQGLLIDNTGQAASNRIWGNLIGTTVTGTARLGNAYEGVYINGGVANQVGGLAPEQRNIIAGNGASGVAIRGRGASNNIVAGNHIGMDAAGQATHLGNLDSGVIIAGGAQNWLQGNLISANRSNGVDLVGGAWANRVTGNRVGTDLTGQQPRGNGGAGVSLWTASNNIVGGAATDARNLISGNTGSGVYLLGSNTRSNWIGGNWVGVAGNGLAPLSNGIAGIWLSGAMHNQIGVPGAGNVFSGNHLYGAVLQNASSNSVQANYLGTGPTSTTRLGRQIAGLVLDQAGGNAIGGFSPGSGNVMSGNEMGASLTGRGTSNNVFYGNFIGTDASGMVAVRNQADGIRIGLNPGAAGSPQNNRIGGMEAGAGNLISANGITGIYLTNAHNNWILGNQIGVRSDGAALGNAAHGIEMEACNNITVGDAATGGGNIIAHAGNVPFDYSGVRIRSGEKNAVVGNAIFSNSGLGIGLGVKAAGRTVLVNDVCDTDTGANRLQNYPVLASALTDGQSLVLQGYLNSAPNRVYALHFYASPAPNPTGYGEGQFYLGTLTHTAGNLCSNAFRVSLAQAVTPGWVITATATDAQGNTSEFSAARMVTGPPPLRIVLRNPNFNAGSPESAAVALSWEGAADTFALVQADQLQPPVYWYPVVPPAALVSNRFWQIELPPTNPAAYFRLQLR